MDEPIDIVYLWCDDADPTWHEKRLETARRIGCPEDAYSMSACRFRGEDEIKYALRSLDTYAPWVRKVHFVVDDDISLPTWLRIDSSSLHVVRLGEIMPPQFLPCFDSITMEHFLPNIEGLAERFLVANDDMMFGCSTPPSFFFASDGGPICRFGVQRGARAGSRNYTIYHANMENSERVVKEDLGLKMDFAKVYGRAPHHNIDAYCRSVMQECYARYRSKLEAAGIFDFPFRKPQNHLRTIYSYYALATGRAHFRRAPFNASWNKPWWRWMLPARGETLQFYGKAWSVGERMLTRYHPHLFCFNDGPQTTELERRWLAGFYERSFPKPSRYEK